jgi:hypothetical protein
VFSETARDVRRTIIPEVTTMHRISIAAFLTTVILIHSIPSLCAIAGGRPVLDVPGGPWKMEITLYDHPDSERMAVGDATLLEDDMLVVPLTWWPRTGVQRYEWIEEGDGVSLTLVSRDRGLSWQIYDGPAIPEKSFRLADGRLFRIRWKAYEPHPNSDRDAFVRRDYYLYELPEKKMFSVTLGFEKQTSNDGGKNWQTTDIAIPHQAEINGYGMSTARMLSDGTILMPTFGRPTRRCRVRSCGVLRSSDTGTTWQHVRVAFDDSPQVVGDDGNSGNSLAPAPPAGVRAFDEAQLVEGNRPGRVIAIIEEQSTKSLHTSFSNDSGLTWSPPRETGMIGVTPLLLRLKSGSLACAFTNRYHGSQNERGMQVCYSHDDGETWDSKHPARLRDYNARPDGQCLWNFVQFSDGTLFASGWGLKTGCGGGKEVSYAVGFRFTEDFRTPLRAIPKTNR